MSRVHRIDVIDTAEINEWAAEIAQVVEIGFREMCRDIPDGSEAAVEATAAAVRHGSAMAAQRMAERVLNRVIDRLPAGISMEVAEETRKFDA